MIARGTKIGNKFDIDPERINDAQWRYYLAERDAYRRSLRLKWALGVSSIIGLAGLGAYYWKNPQEAIDIKNRSFGFMFNYLAESPLMKSSIMSNLLNNLSPLLKITPSLKK